MGDRGPEARSGRSSGLALDAPMSGKSRTVDIMSIIGAQVGRVETDENSSATSGAQRLVSYLVMSTPSGNVRVSTRFKFTQLSRAVKNGVPLPTKTGAVTNTYSSISPARIAAEARVAPAISM